FTLAGALLASTAAAEGTTAEPTGTRDAEEQRAPDPPPNSLDYLQYGVALSAEALAEGGQLCPANRRTACVLGSGGGLAIRVGYRSRGAWLATGAYEFSRHDASNLLRLPILQQLRGELRYYLERGTRLAPYAAAGLGLSVYGSEWGVSTGGPVAVIGAGLEFQITQSTVVGCAPMYRAFLLRRFTDSTGELRAGESLGFGLAHFVAFELVLEVRDPLPRW